MITSEFRWTVSTDDFMKAIIQAVTITDSVKLNVSGYCEDRDGNLYHLEEESVNLPLTSKTEGLAVMDGKFVFPEEQITMHFWK